MSNRLKEIFSEDKSTLTCDIKFETLDARNKFFKAVEDSLDNDKKEIVNGVSQINAYIEKGSDKYPFQFFNGPLQMELETVKPQIVFEIDTEFGRKKLVFCETRKNESVFLETEKDSILDLKMEFKEDCDTFRMAIFAQPDKASKMQEIVEYYTLVYVFLKMILEGCDNAGDGVNEISAEEDGRESDVRNIMDYLKHDISLYKRVVWLEQEFKISFEPGMINDDQKSWLNFEEFYLLLNKKETLRLDANVNVGSYAEINMDKPLGEVKQGDAIDFSFLGSIQAEIWGQTLTVYTANLLINAIVKAIVRKDDGGTKILYTTSEKRPMYISYKGFLTEDEAEQETKQIISDKESYVNALTLNEHLQKNNTG